MHELRCIDHVRIHVILHPITIHIQLTTLQLVKSPNFSNFTQTRCRFVLSLSLSSFSLRFRHSSRRTSSSFSISSSARTSTNSDTCHQFLCQIMGLTDSESCADQIRKCQDLSQNSTECLDETWGEEANKAKVESSLGPITPDVNKENGDFPLDLSSPLTVVKKLPKVLTFDSQTNRNQDPLVYIDDSTSPRTPKDGVFDPFAPGPEDKVLAPMCKKYSDEARISVTRRLNFGSSIKVLDYTSPGDDAESISDEEIFKSVYENLLEAIVSNQTETSLAELSNMEWDSEACRTPQSAPQLNGVAETCPGAPLKPTGKSRIIDLGLCRKLEF